MKFTRLTLENYKIYHGQQTFDLDVPRDQKPPHRKNLILIGGLNGHGKTTILNAILISLFGLNEKDAGLQNSLINEQFFYEGGRTCVIELTMSDDVEEVTLRTEWIYNDRRTVTNTNRTVLIVDRSTNQRREAHIMDEEYREFINQRIPFEVSQFFLFDGEKIQEMVEAQKGDVLKRAIQQIVSLESYKSLLEHLVGLQREAFRTTERLKSDRPLKELRNGIEKLDSEIDEARIQTKIIDPQIQQLEEQAKQVDRLRREKLTANLKSKQELVRKDEQIRNRLSGIDELLSNYQAQKLPYLFLEPTILRLQKTLREERDYLAQKSQLDAVFAPYESFIKQLLDVDIQPELSFVQKNQLTQEGKRVWQEVNRIHHQPMHDRSILHDIAPGVRENILSVKLDSNLDIAALLNEKKTLTNELKELEQKIEEAPEMIDTSDEERLIQSIREKIGELKSSLRKYRDLIIRHTSEISSMHNKAAEQQKKQSGDEYARKEHEFLTNMVNATGEYIDELTKIKAAKIKTEFESILQRLIFKGQDFADAEFDEETFTIRVFNDRGEQIRLEDRSAGEKQILALCFIWALTKTAELPLPFVIDTPLGRLDSIHRAHLVQHFFNALSEQVIILSTDTEVNRDYLQAVEPYLVRSYELKFDTNTKSTQIHEGYFSFE